MDHCSHDLLVAWTVHLKIRSELRRKNHLQTKIIHVFGFQIFGFLLGCKAFFLCHAGNHFFIFHVWRLFFLTVSVLWLEISTTTLWNKKPTKCAPRIVIYGVIWGPYKCPKTNRNKWSSGPLVITGDEAHLVPSLWFCPFFEGSPGKTWVGFGDECSMSPRAKSISPKKRGGCFTHHFITFLLFEWCWKTKMKGTYMTSWWMNQPIWKICDSQIGSFPPNRDEK